MSLIEEVRGVVVTGEDRSGRPETSAQEVSWNSPEMKARHGGRKGGEGHPVESALLRKVLQDKYVSGHELFERGFRTRQHDSRYPRDMLRRQININ